MPRGASAVVNEQRQQNQAQQRQTEDPRIAQMQQQIEKQNALMEKLLAQQGQQKDTGTARQVPMGSGRSVQDSIMNLLDLSDLERREALLNVKFLDELNRVSNDPKYKNSYEKAFAFRTWMSDSGDFLDKATRPWIVTTLFAFFNGLGKAIFCILILAIAMVLFGGNSVQEFFGRQTWARNIIMNITDFFKGVTAMIMFLGIFLVWLFIFIYDRGWNWSWTYLFWVGVGFIFVAFWVTNALDPASRGKWWSLRRGRLASGQHADEEAEVIHHS